MEQIKEILGTLANRADEAGRVTTLLGGRITATQLVVGVVALVLLLLVWKVIKSGIKIVLTVVIVVLVLVHYGIASPAQLKDAAAQIAEEGVERYQQIADMSQNIQVVDGDVQVKLGGQWVSVPRIQSVVQGARDVLTVTVDGVSYTTEDSAVIELLNSFR